MADNAVNNTQNAQSTSQGNAPGPDLNQLQQFAQQQLSERPDMPNEVTRGSGGGQQSPQSVQQSVSQSVPQADMQGPQHSSQGTQSTPQVGTPGPQVMSGSPQNAQTDSQSPQLPPQSTSQDDDPLRKLIGMVKGDSGKLDEIKVKELFVVVKQKLTNKSLRRVVDRGREMQLEENKILDFVLELDRMIEEGELNEDKLIQLSQFEA